MARNHTGNSNAVSEAQPTRALKSGEVDHCLGSLRSGTATVTSLTRRTRQVRYLHRGDQLS